MAASHSGANYFLLQARTIAEHANVDAANSTLDTPITRRSRAPYKGMKQTTGAIKYLKAKIHRHAQDLKKVGDSLSETRPTSRIGVKNHVVQHPIHLIKGDTMPKPATLKFNHTLTLPTIIEEALEQKPTEIKIHFQKSAAGLQTPPESPEPKPSGIKLRIPTTTKPTGIRLRIPTITNSTGLKLRIPSPRSTAIKLRIPTVPRSSDINVRIPSPKSVTTENNGIAKQYRLQFKLNPEDRLPKAFMNEWIHRLMAKYAAWSTFDPMNIDTDIETNNNKNLAEVLNSSVILNNKHYGSTRVFPISYIPKKMTAEEKKKAKDDEKFALAPERLRLKEHREKRKVITRNLIIRNANCDYFKALQREEKKPTLVPSQLQPICQRVQQFQSKGPALHERYDETISKKAVGAFARAEKIIADRSKVANLIRANKGKEVKNKHVLSSIPLHMRLHETYNGTRAMGRIEYGLERRWGHQAFSPLGRST